MSEPLSGAEKANLLFMYAFDTDELDLAAEVRLFVEETPDANDFDLACICANYWRDKYLEVKGW